MSPSSHLARPTLASLLDLRHRRPRLPHVLRGRGRAPVAAAPVTFSARGRVEVIAELTRAELDVLVVGGGITGVGVALDAASRGLRVGIVEADDWASGTSSRSSKMIHGGLRYLATGDLGVVRESLRERAALQRNAAHLVRPLPMLLPVYGRGPVPFQRIKLAVGLWLYELLGHRRAAGELHRWIPLSTLTRTVPGVATRSEAGGGALRGAFGYHDGCADDARLVMSVLRTAVAHGAHAVNGTRVETLLRDGERVCGATVTGDAVDEHVGAAGSRLDVRARVVVNAAGVWADTVGGGAQEAGFRVAPSKGIHLTVRRDRSGVDSGIAFFEQTGNANVFLEPWQDDLVFVGTTDTPYSGELASPDVTDADIDWLLGKVNLFLRQPLLREDVVASWAGLRPLVRPDSGDGDGADTKDVSRRHLLVDRPGIVTITGGKLTAYRSMAEAAVDAAARQLGRVERSVTRHLRLDGCRHRATADEVAQVAARLCVERTVARHLLRRHGANLPQLEQLLAQHPELVERLHPDRPYLAVEALWAARHEQARDVEDVLERRTRLGIEVRDPERAAPVVERLLARGGSIAVA